MFTEEQALALLFEGESSRAIAEHGLNARSSRSHCIFTVYIEVTSHTTPCHTTHIPRDTAAHCLQSQSKVESNAVARVAKLHFVDLAGSERVAKTQARPTTHCMHFSCRTGRGHHAEGGRVHQPLAQLP